MDDFGKYLPPLGKLIVNHLDRMSMLVCHPDKDIVAIDAEVNHLYQLLMERLSGDKAERLKSTGKTAMASFRELADRMRGGFLADPHRGSYQDEETWRLSIRQDMEGVLIGGAIRAGLLDESEKPHSTYVPKQQPRSQADEAA